MMNEMMKMMKSLLSVLVVGWFTVSMQAQITVGVDEAALDGAIMQWKQFPESNNSLENAYNGLGFPRVWLSDVNNLYPMFLAEPADPNCNIPAPVYDSPDKKADLDQKHTGLVVYNINNSPEKGLFAGLATWNGSQWMPLGSPSSKEEDLRNLNNSEAKYFPTAFVVKGIYKKGVDLDNTNFIEVTLTVNEECDYAFATDVVDGISFAADGHFSTAEKDKVIRLLPEAGEKPTVHTNIPLTIYYLDENAGVKTHDVIVPVTAPSKVTYAIISNTPKDLSDYGYTWSSPARLAALELKANFGPDGIVKVDNFERLWIKGAHEADQVLTAALNSGNNIPDIILYNTYSISITQGVAGIYNYLSPDLRDALINYVKGKGCLIFGGSSDDVTIPAHQNTRYTRQMLDDIFNEDLELDDLPNTASPYYTCNSKPSLRLRADDNNFLINNYPNDPIINGPFLNLSYKDGKPRYWGSDNGHNVAIRNLPDNKIVQICSAQNNTDYCDQNENTSIVFYGKEGYNLFFIGDTSGSSSNPQHLFKTSEVPAFYNNGTPQSKSYGPTGNKETVYNSYLEMNAVAWAIKRALTDGINPH